MLFNIVEIIKDRIDVENLNYVDKLAGLVTLEHVKKQSSKTTTVDKSYPVYCSLNNDCDTSKILPLIPDRKLKSLFYFEDLRGINVLGTEKGFINYSASVRLIGWINPKLLGSTDCDIKSMIMTEIIHLMIGNTFNSGVYTKIKTNILSIPPKSENLFSNYKYSDKFVELLDKPYDYFAIDLSIEFSIHKNCLISFNSTPPIVC